MGLPARSGKLPDLVHFDAAFFGVAPVQAMNMDPQVRILLETVYETFIDAGVLAFGRLCQHPGHFNRH